MENTQTNNIGTIDVRARESFVTITIGKQAGSFVAAAMIKGSIWYETAETGIAALLLLANRLNSVGV